MRRVLLTDSAQDVLDDLADALGDHFEVRACCHGTQLPGLLKSFDPDILLLDLSMPGYDPGQLLRGLKERKLPIIASALDSNDYMTRLLDDLGVRWLMMKPLHADGVAARLLDLELVLDRKPDRPLRSAVYDQMLQMGVRLRYQGFVQLAEGIVYACGHEGCAITEMLYPHVAQVCGGTPSSVEKVISRCIEQAFARRRRYIWASVFGDSAKEKCPTNSRFISHLAHAVHKQLS